MTGTTMSPPLRSTAFGPLTRIKSRSGKLRLKLAFNFLRLVKPERDARALGSRHFAYWVLLPSAARSPSDGSGRQTGSDEGGELLFLSDFSGDHEVYLAGFNVALRPVLDLVWGSAQGWKRQMKLGEYRSVRRLLALQPAGSDL